MASATLPNSLRTIKGTAFKGCKGLTSIAIPEGVNFIGEGAFNGCSAMTRTTIPNSAFVIGREAFIGCSMQNDVYTYITNPLEVSIHQNTYQRYPYSTELRTLHVPKGTLADYRLYNNWRRFFGNIVEMDSDPALPGDMSGDGVLGVTDVTMLINLIMSSDETTEFPPEADFNGDGKVDVSDVTMLISSILSMQQ